ncbi:MAG: hypothetical protein IPP46_06065 [Bacteroidetes bacterium]|nr:hypothetical protein [Bacteroidota bacterium]
MRKEGSANGLPIALTILFQDQIPSKLFLIAMIMGELSPDGRLMPVQGA